MSASLSSADDIHSRSLEPSPTGLLGAPTLGWDIKGTAAHIRRGFRRVALQFPDFLLHVAPKVLDELSAELQLPSAADGEDGGEGVPPVQLFVLADTSFDGFQLDFVAAQHVAAELLVHYGPADLGARGPIEARYVFGDEPVDVDALVQAIQATFPREGPLVVVPALRYAHAAHALAEALAAVKPGAMVAAAEVECSAFANEAHHGTTKREPTDPSSAGDADGTPLALDAVKVAVGLGQSGSGITELLGRKLPRPLSRDEMVGCPLLYIGGADESTLSNLAILFSEAPIHVCGACGGLDGNAVGPSIGHTGKSHSSNLTISRLELQTSKRLMRRYYLVQQAKEAAVVGILVGSLSTAWRAPMLKAIKRLISARGRKYYVFLMGKLNSAKLANFTEVGCYVLLGSSEHSLIDARDFFRPVITPFELMLAFGHAEDWTGEYMLDYAPLLPRLAIAANEAQGTRGTGASKHGNASEALDSDEDAPPEHSLLSGRMIGVGGYGADTGCVMSEEGGELTTTGGALTKTGDYALARTGAEFLNRRSWKGLEVRRGETAPAEVQQGRRGIASGFVQEGHGSDGGPTGRSLLRPKQLAAGDVAASPLTHRDYHTCIRVVANSSSHVAVRIRIGTL